MKKLSRYMRSDDYMMLAPIFDGYELKCLLFAASLVLRGETTRVKFEAFRDGYSCKDGTFQVGIGMMPTDLPVWLWTLCDHGFLVRIGGFDRDGTEYELGTIGDIDWEYVNESLEEIAERSPLWGKDDHE